MKIKVFAKNGCLIKSIKKTVIYIQTGKLHFTTKYNFHQNKMATVLYDIKMGHCMLPTLTIFKFNSLPNY